MSKKKIFVPYKIFNDVSEINLDYLNSEGLKGLILDLDDTLVPSDTKKNLEHIDDWLINIKKNIKIYVVSNNSKPSYVKKYCDKFDIPYIARALKPRKKNLIKAINEMGLKSNEVAIVGDRVTTDILSGNRLKIKTFLVKPLFKNTNNLKKILYKFENYLIN